jgi:hypothetical protein
MTRCDFAFAPLESKLREVSCCGQNTDAAEIEVVFSGCQAAKAAFKIPTGAPLERTWISASRLSEVATTLNGVEV